MSDALARQENVLIEALDTAMRGPRRNGLFAVWLILRSCGDLLSPNPVSERGHRRRSQGLAMRLRSLSLPVPLRRALEGALMQLGDGTSRGASIALQQLVAPVRETLGSTCADAVDRAAQIVREEVRIAKPG